MLPLVSFVKTGYTERTFLSPQDVPAGNIPAAGRVPKWAGKIPQAAGKVPK
jgi:hypothetical protein